MSRQRIRTGMLESSSLPCVHCGGSGYVRATASVALQILRAIEESLLKSTTHNLILRTRTEVALYILNQKRAHLRELGDPLRRQRYHCCQTSAWPRHPRSSSIEVSRRSEARGPQLVSAPWRFRPRVDTDDDFDGDEEEEAVVDAEAEASEVDGSRENSSDGNGEGRSGGRRRRRRRRGGRHETGESTGEHSASGDDHSGDEDVDGESQDLGDQAGDAQDNTARENAADEIVVGDAPDSETTPRSELSEDEGAGRRRRRGRRGGRGRDRNESRPRDDADEEQNVSDPVQEGAPVSVDLPPDASEAALAPVSVDLPIADEPSLKPIEAATREAPDNLHDTSTSDLSPEPAPAPIPAPEPVAVVLTPIDPDRPKRAGWWSRTKAALTGE